MVDKSSKNNLNNLAKRLFREDVLTMVAGELVSEGEMKITPHKGREITNLLVRSVTPSGTLLYTIPCWEELAKQVDGLPAHTRIYAMGRPDHQIYNNQVRHQIRVIELWVENNETKQLVCFLSRKGEEEVEPKAPIEMPDEVPAF